jgi:hypothetical protein
VLLDLKFWEDTHPDDGGGDGWWSGTQQCFVQVARVGAALALSTSVAIAGNFTQQDDLPINTASSEGGGISSPNWRKKEHTAYQRWWAQDEFVTPVATPAFEDDSWSPPTLVIPKTQIQGPSWDDEALFWPLEETYDWTARWVTPPINISGPAWDDQSPAWTIDEQYDWAAKWTKAASTQFTPAWADEDFVPAVASALDDGSWLNLNPQVIKPLVSIFVETGSEDVPLLVAGGDWSNTIVSSQRLRHQTQFQRWWPQDDIVTAATPIGFDEEPWQVFGAVLQKAQAAGPVWAGDEIVTPPAAVSLDDQDVTWSPPTLVVPKIQIQGPNWNDEALFWPVEEVRDWSAPKWLSASITVSGPTWADEQIVPAGSLGIDDEPWQVRTPTAPPATVRLWIDQDETLTPPPPLGVDEEPWQVYSPPPIPAIVRVWTWQDERTTPPAPLGVDDDYWQPFAAARTTQCIWKWWINEDYPALASQPDIYTANSRERLGGVRDFVEFGRVSTAIDFAESERIGIDGQSPPGSDVKRDAVIERIDSVVATVRTKRIGPDIL